MLDGEKESSPHTLGMPLSKKRLLRIGYANSETDAFTGLLRHLRLFDSFASMTDLNENKFKYSWINLSYSHLSANLIGFFPLTVQSSEHFVDLSQGIQIPIKSFLYELVAE